MPAFYKTKGLEGRVSVALTLQAVYSPAWRKTMECDNALSTSDLLAGMLVMLPPRIRFTEEMFYKFLRKESESEPVLRSLFRSLKGQCGDKCIVLDDQLFFMNGTLIEDNLESLRMLESMREPFMALMRADGTLPQYEALFKGMAERFTAFIKQAWKQRKTSAA